MTVVVNGERRELHDETTVADVVRTLVDAERGVAVALDGEVVRRGEWDARSVPDGSRVEVLTAMQGG